jgi:glycerol-3-phosphate dehydrogenase
LAQRTCPRFPPVAGDRAATCPYIIPREFGGDGWVVFGKVYDVAVIGGGLNGVAIARDAAGRGLSVFLCEQGDLGSGASSASGKLIHGKLDHLEGLRFAAMHEAVAEREILMRAAPHLVRPLTFLIPRHERQWSPVTLRLVLFAYDHAARSSLPGARMVDLDAETTSASLQSHFTVAFTYSDCFADDSRLVIHNALDARARGATISTRLRCTVAERDGNQWRLAMESTATGERSVVLAQILVNAAGAMAGEVREHVVHAASQERLRLTRSAWLVVRRDVRDEVAYALPNADGRIVYALPYEAGTMLLGPAVTPHSGTAASARVEPAEIAYLADVADQYFHTPVDDADIVQTFASVRALPTEPGEVRNGRAIVVDAPPQVAPLLSVFGGSLTLHRRLAEEVVDRMGRFRSVPPAWTEGAILPGGGFPRDGAVTIARALSRAYPFISESHVARLVAAYGTRASDVLTGARGAAALGRRFGGDLTEAEVAYLRREEWADTAEDILWRRSKLGLSFDSGEVAALVGWLGEASSMALPAA